MNSELKFSEFRDEANRFICPSCPIGQKGCQECEDSCIECFLEYRKHREEIRRIEPEGCKSRKEPDQTLSHKGEIDDN